MNMEKIKITVVVPVYNVAPYISSCLQSVMNQTYQGRIECLIIDDCGTDNSMEIVDELLKSYQRRIDFRICRHDKNRGLSAARNTGINQATGDYIYFLDSDDEITPDCLEKLASPLSNQRYDFVIGGYKVIGAQYVVPQLLISDGTDLRDDNIMQAYYKERWYMMAWGKLCGLAFLRKNNLYFEEGLIHEDELWSFQMACLAKSMYVVNQESYVYKIREGSITMNQKTQVHRVAAFQKILCRMVDFVLEKKVGSKYAHLKVFDVLFNLTDMLSSQTEISKQEQISIVKHHRRNLGRIPYSKRLASCLVNARKAVLYGAVVLPASFCRSYNLLLCWLIRKTYRSKQR